MESSNFLTGIKQVSEWMMNDIIILICVSVVAVVICCGFQLLQHKILVSRFVIWLIYSNYYLSTFIKFALIFQLIRQLNVFLFLFYSHVCCFFFLVFSKKRKLIKFIDNVICICYEFILNNFRYFRVVKTHEKQLWINMD